MPLCTHIHSSAQIMFLLLICYYCGYQGTEETIEWMKTGVEKKTEHIRLLVKVSRSSPEFKSIGSVCFCYRLFLTFRNTFHQDRSWQILPP